MTKNEFKFEPDFSALKALADGIKHVVSSSEKQMLVQIVEILVKALEAKGYGFDGFLEAIGNYARSEGMKDAAAALEYSSLLAQQEESKDA